VTDGTASALADALRDRYRLERELGAGGMATVWLARDLRHDRPVALKVLRPELAAALGAERFLREIRLTAVLQHPHILPLLDSGEAAGRLFYVMPYVEGNSLRQRLQRDGQLPLDEAIRLTEEAAEALDYAHGLGIIHRDIKPENLLLSRGHVLLADFGIALAVSEAGGGRLTETGLSLGTPAYMSPEQAMAEPRLDGRSDQYSLACVLYEMLAGEPPYTGPSAQAVVAKRLTEPVPRLGVVRDVPAAVSAALDRALARSPADRFAKATEFGMALEAETPAGRQVAAFRVTFFRRRLLAAIGIGMALAGGLGALALARRAPSGFPDLLPGRVVIAPFDNRTGDPALESVGIMVAEWLTQGLSSTPLVEVVDSRSLMASVQAIRDAGGQGDPALRLAHETRAGTVVAGSIYQVADSLRFQARIADAGSARLRLTVDPITIPARDPVPALEPLRRRVTGALASLLDDRLNNPGVTTSRPPSYEAYQEYVLGMANYGRDLKGDIAHFARAVALDSSYTQALLWLGIAQADIGEIGLADSIFSLAETHRERLAPYDQANLDYFARGFARGDWEGSYGGARRMLELAPSAEHAKWAVALTSVVTHRPHEALAMLSRIDTTRGWGRTWRFGVASVAAGALHHLGDFVGDLAIAKAAAGAADAPVEWFLGVEARALAALQRDDEVFALPFESVHGEAPGSLMLRTAAELSAHGSPDEGRRMYRRASEWYGAKAAGDTAAVWRAGLAYSLLGAESWPEARELYAKLQRQDPTEVTNIGALGLVAARTGNRSAADGALETLSTSSGSHLYGEAAWWRARILAILGRTEEAVAAIEQSYREGRASDYRDRLNVGGNHNFHLYGPELTKLHEDPRIQDIFRVRG